jgi:hypothetical protein
VRSASAEAVWRSGAGRTCKVDALFARGVLRALGGSAQRKRFPVTFSEIIRRDPAPRGRLEQARDHLLPAWPKREINHCRTAKKCSSAIRVTSAPWPVRGRSTCGRSHPREATLGNSLPPRGQRGESEPGFRTAQASATGAAPAGRGQQEDLNQRPK